MCRLLGLVLVGLAFPPTVLAADSCPPPSVERGGSCVLTEDVVLDKTIELVSFTSLNCDGNRILPRTPGSGAPNANYAPSIPEIGILISGQLGVAVKNCVIGGEDMRFDFGIVAMNSKLSGSDGHRIANNEIHAREAGVTLLRVDDAQVSDNVITWTNGSGIRVRRNSDRNRVTNNSLSSPGSPAAPSRVVPGGDFFAFADDGVVLGAFQLQPLYNLVFEGELFQFPNFEDGGYPGNEENIVEGNLLSLPGSSTGKSHSGVLVVTNESRSKIIGNEVIEAGMGIRLAGLRPNQVVTRVSQCVDSEGAVTNRFCVLDSDCFISGIDPEPIGTCSPPIQDVVDLRADSTLVAENVLVGPFNSPREERRAGIVGGNGTANGVIRENHVFGTGIEVGISLGANMIESGIVVDNRVQDTAFGFLLFGSEATFFGACVAFNDITGSVVQAIGTSGGYALPSEISCMQSGNYWGHRKPPCFRSLDSPDESLIRDSYPFCRPVAAP